MPAPSQGPSPKGPELTHPRTAALALAVGMPRFCNSARSHVDLTHHLVHGQSGSSIAKHNTVAINPMVNRQPPLPQTSSSAAAAAQISRQMVRFAR